MFVSPNRPHPSRTTPASPARSSTPARLSTPARPSALRPARSVHDAFERQPLATRPPPPTRPAPALPQATAGAPWQAPNAGLRLGSTGPAVGQLQDGLVALGHANPSSLSSGVFGRTTQAALQAFQRSQGLHPDGIYSTIAQQALQRALHAVPSSSESSSSVPSSSVPSSSVPSSSGSLGDPTGYSTTVPDARWEDVNRWDPIVESAAQEFGVPADLLKAMMVIESRGNPDAWRGSDGLDDVPAVGLMQVKTGYWGHLVPDADGNTPEGNVRIAAALLRKAYDEHGSWDAAITNVYFPADDVNGTSQQEYLRMVDGLRGEINAAR